MNEHFLGTRPPPPGKNVGWVVGGLLFGGAAIDGRECYRVAAGVIARQQVAVPSFKPSERATADRPFNQSVFLRRVHSPRQLSVNIIVTVAFVRSRRVFSSRKQYTVVGRQQCRRQQRSRCIRCVENGPSRR